MAERPDGDGIPIDDMPPYAPSAAPKPQPDVDGSNQYPDEQRLLGILVTDLARLEIAWRAGLKREHFRFAWHGRVYAALGTSRLEGWLRMIAEGDQIIKIGEAKSQPIGRAAPHFARLIREHGLEPGHPCADELVARLAARIISAANGEPHARMNGAAPPEPTTVKTKAPAIEREPVGRRRLEWLTVVAESDPSRMALRLAIALAWKHTDRQGETFATVETMADYLGTTKATLVQILFAFRKAGFIETTQPSTKNKHLKFRLTLPAGTLKPHPTAQPILPLPEQEKAPPKPRKRVLTPRQSD
jgi:hypothetical protein